MLATMSNIKHSTIKSGHCSLLQCPNFEHPNMNVQAFFGPRSLTLCPRPLLSLYTVWVNSKCFGETVHLSSLTHC